MDSNLYKTDFSGCSLKGADFTHAIVWSTVLKDAILDGANMITAHLGGTYVPGASVNGLMIAEDQISKLDGLTATQEVGLRIAKWRHSTHPVSVVVASSADETNDR